MPTELLPPQLTPDQRRERIAAILARGVRRRMVAMRMSNVATVDESMPVIEASPTLKLVAPSQLTVR